MQAEPSSTHEDEPAPAPQEDAIPALVARLSRPHPSGGTVIERAAIMAAGADSAAVLQWIADRGGKPEALSAPKAGGGLFADRGGAARQTLRYVLPPG